MKHLLVLVGPGNDFKNKFSERFSNSACHPPNTLLGMKFKRIGDRIFLSQPKHINHGLEELGLTKCKPSSTPLTPNLQLREALDEDHEKFKKLNINYQSAIDLLHYIASNTQPDLTFAVSSLACYSIKPGLSHWKEVKKTWQYLCHTKDLKFTINPVKPSEFFSIFSNATWGNDPDSRTFQSGYLCYLFGSLVSWNSCRQLSITYSSTKAELNPLVESFHEGLWLKALINEMWHLQIESASHFIDDPELIQQLTVDNKTFKERYCTNDLIDNKGLNDKLKKFGTNSKTRHIDLRTKCFCQEIKNKNIKITLFQTQDMTADALTKPTSIEPLKNLTKTIDPDFNHQI
ncbi:hypothetical protein VP01_3062g2 [Puccinia sorghi]|uniref:Reverse transcriptase Ty1/copia-type domain-containing protein n=1 Tax=Puccinia sorghi TaxID=27349 RepID=A0A0L6UZT5_9BASI|nr:hypothetical protein VP01_3062g2 [Puccinia sorghi]